MVVLWRCILVLALLLAAAPRASAASAADRAFEAAAKAFQDGFYDRAEAQLGDFSQKYPTSPRVLEAVLLQAQARLELANYAGAIQLLAAHQGNAGTNADQFLFWLGQGYLRKGEWQPAVNTFARVVKDFPNSSRQMEAALGEASARVARAQTDPAEWPRVLDLLRQTNGVFQSLMATNPGSALSAQACLLLAEAQLATKDYRGAEQTLQPLAKHLLKPLPAWQWQHLLCRVQLADGRVEAALQGTTNLLAQAASTGQKPLQAESAAFQAGLFERLGRTNDVIAAYQLNLVEGIPAERQREALLKITDLYLAQGRIVEAAQTLEQFLAKYPNAAAADLALLTLGELRLRPYALGLQPGGTTSNATNSAAATNGVALAQAAFNTLVKDFPQSPLWGKAQLNLGWCYLRQGQLPEAEAALQAAVGRLPQAKDQAIACFRLADAQFQQKKYTAALQNYRRILEEFAALPEVKANLLEAALTQTVRAALEVGDLATATNKLAQARALYPNQLDTARAVLLTGQELRRRGDAEGERRLLQDFARSTPASPLLPEVQLAVATSFEQEKKWAEAIAQYDQWLASFTTNNLRARAEYNRAWDTAQAGRPTNALALFTNFVAHFPADALAPYAQMWVADYYNDARDFMEAERNYKSLFQNTNWAASELAYEAQLMAGRAAVQWQNWKPVKEYFTGLYNNTNGPSETMRLQAFCEYGESLLQWVDPGDTNKLANLEMATLVFGRICDQYPTNQVTVRAWIGRGNCYKEWALARQEYDSLTNALNAYQRIAESQQADVSARSKAKIGKAIVLEKWAEQKSGAERSQMLNQALSNCLDVVYGNILVREDEKLDPFYTKEAGIKAFSLAESLQAWAQMISLYDRLTTTVWPQLPGWMVESTRKAREKLSQAPPPQ